MKIPIKNPEIRLPSLSNPTIKLPSLKRGGGNDAGLVGLEIEAGSIAAAELDGAGGAVSGVAVRSLPPSAVDDGEIADPQAVADSLRELFAEHKLSKRVRLGIANQRVVVRTVRLPAIEDPKELDSAIRFSAQEQVAMPLEQAVIDHRVVGGVAATDGSPPQIDVMVVAARRDMIAATLKPLRDAGLDPVGVDLSAFGMIRALADAGRPAEVEPPTAETDEPPDRTQAAVLYCNVSDVSNLAVAKGRSCLFTRVSPVGLEELATDLAAETGLTLEHARMWLDYTGLERPLAEIEGDPALLAKVRAALESGASSLLGELRLSLDFYGAQEGAVPVDRVVLSGPGSTIGGIAGWMEPTLGLPISIGRPAALAGLDDASAARLTLPYGLALES